MRAVVAGILSSALIHAHAGSADGGLYRALGEAEGLHALVGKFVDHLFVDPRTAPFFRDSTKAAAIERLEAQFCELSGGPCKTINPDMRKTHSGFDVRNEDFDAVIAILRQSMAERRIDARSQERLLESLTPMRSEIVNTP